MSPTAESDILAVWSSENPAAGWPAKPNTAMCLPMIQPPLNQPRSH